MFESGSQSLIIANKCFVQVKPSRQQKEIDQTISMAGQKETFKTQPRFFFFSSFRNLTTQLKVSTDQNIQSVVPLETD